MCRFSLVFFLLLLFMTRSCTHFLVTTEHEWIWTWKAYTYSSCNHPRFKKDIFGRSSPSRKSNCSAIFLLMHYKFYYWCLNRANTFEENSLGSLFISYNNNPTSQIYKDKKSTRTHLCDYLFLRIPDIAYTLPGLVWPMRSSKINISKFGETSMFLK